MRLRPPLLDLPRIRFPPPDCSRRTIGSLTMYKLAGDERAATDRLTLRASAIDHEPEAGATGFARAPAPPPADAGAAALIRSRLRRSASVRQELPPRAPRR